jgi:hypothetical protein
MRPPRRPAGRRRSLVALGLVAAVGAVWGSVRPQASLLVANRLTEPIALTLDDTGFTIPPSDSLRVPLRPRQPVEAHWAMVRPTGTDGRVLGAELEGSIVRDKARGELREVVGAGALDGQRFSPLVVNGVGRRIRAIVIAGGDSSECGCSVAPGDSIRLGYHALVPGSAVRVIDVRGATARFDVAEAGVDSLSGAVKVRVTEADLVAPPPRHPAPAGRRRGEPGADPLRSFLPVR